MGSSIKIRVIKLRVMLLEEKIGSKRADGTGGWETLKGETHGMILEI